MEKECGSAEPSQVLVRLACVFQRRPEVVSFSLSNCFFPANCNNTSLSISPRTIHLYATSIKIIKSLIAVVSAYLASSELYRSGAVLRLGSVVAVDKMAPSKPQGENATNSTGTGNSNGIVKRRNRIPLSCESCRSRK